MACTPADLWPGIGLRPGGERPDLEDFVERCYRALFDSIAACRRLGISVVSDLGIHDWYSRPLEIWHEAATRLEGVPTHLIGVRCSLQAILERRAASSTFGGARYETAEGGRTPDAVLRWDQAVHRPGWYDYEVDTSHLGADDCAALVLAHIEKTEPGALDRHRRDR